MPTAALAAFVLGVCALQWQARLPSTVVLSAMLFFGGVLGLSAVRTSRRQYALAAAIVAAATIGFASAGLRAQLRLGDELSFADEGRDLRVTGVVSSLPVRGERGLRFEFDVETHDPEYRVPAHVLLAWYGAVEPVRPGERWSLAVRLRRPHGVMNPAGFDFEAWMLERDLRATGTVRNTPRPALLDPMVWSVGTAVERGRWWLRERLDAYTSEQRYGGVLQALVLGDQRAIRDADWTLFNRTGIAHLVSISGLHITMIAALIGGVVAAVWRRVPWLLRRAPVQSAAVIAGVVAATLYALLAGWGVPAQRTVLMLAVAAIAWLARRQVNLGSALALAAAAVCLFDPWAVTAAGFWLSFGAVAAIAWVVQGRPYERSAFGWSALKTAARVQVAVTLALVPATVLLFHQVSLISPLANAVAIPVVSWVITPLALLGAACAAMPWPLTGLAGPLLTSADGLFGGLAAALQWISAPAWAALTLPAPPWPILLIATLGVAWSLAPPGWPLRWAGVMALLPLLAWPGERPAPGALWITALDVGQGAAVVIETRDQAWLYDAGPRYSQESDAGERIVLPYLRSRGLSTLDGLIISHLDQDHSGGAGSVIRGVAVRRVISSVDAGHPVLAGAASERCTAGLEWIDGALQWRAVHPLDGDYQRSLSTNAMSCVVRARLGNTAVLLTGDLPAREEQELVAREADLHARWLMVPHHGSRSSSTAALLAAVHPEVALLQAGYRNRFGHPHAEVLARYAEYGIPVVRTDHAGAAQWRFAADGTTESRFWRSFGARYWHNRPGIGQVQPKSEADQTAEEAPGQPFFGMP